MSRGLMHWWPILPALVILYFGGSAFMEGYPESTHRALDFNSRSRGPDSLIAFIEAGRHSDSLLSSLRGKTADNPFRPVHGSANSGDKPAPGPRPDPPFRKFILRGTVGTEVATITDRGGHKLIVKVGDGVDSATVISIEPNKVVLKDRAGKFELLQEK
jgi:hypothetical protein